MQIQVTSSKEGIYKAWTTLGIRSIDVPVGVIYTEDGLTLEEVFRRFRGLSEYLHTLSDENVELWKKDNEYRSRF